MLIGTLSAQHLQQTYLRGVDLGAAWQGPSADAALETILWAWIEIAQGKLGVQFATQRVRTYPDPGLVLGTDYEIQGEPLTWFPLPPGMAHYAMPLPFAHIQSIERVRLFFGNPGADPTGKARYEVPPQWILFTQKEGILKIVPSTSVPLLPPLSSLAYDMGAVWGRTRYDLPGVWAVDYTIGYGQVPLDVAHWINLHAAIDVLGQAGTALAHGLSSESLSMDGITREYELWVGGVWSLWRAHQHVQGGAGVSGYSATEGALSWH